MSTNELSQLREISKDESNNQEELDYEILKDHPNYIIMKEYPHEVFNRKTGRQVTESLHSDTNGYRHLWIDGRYEYKHRLVANQWIHNDDPINKIHVDHINGIKYDNRIENLRYCTAKENNNNKHTMKRRLIIYKDELTDDVMQIHVYGDHQFDDLYYDQEYFWRYNGMKYYRIEYYSNKTGAISIQATTVNNTRVTISLIKFKQLYNL
jgi:hypothetical protein